MTTRCWRWRWRWRVQNAIATNSQQVGKSAARLLTASKLVRSDPSRLDKAYVDLNASVQSLLHAIDNANPGSSEMADALRAIDGALARVGLADGNKDQQANRKLLNDAAKSLGENVGQMSVSARNNPERLGPQSREAARAVGQVVVAANNLSPDYIDLQTPADRINEQLPRLAHSNTAVPAAKEIAKATSSIVNQSKAFLTNNPDLLDPVRPGREMMRDALSGVCVVAGDDWSGWGGQATKRELVNAAQSLSADTSRLAEAAKAFAQGDEGAENALRDISRSVQQETAAIKAVAGKVQAKSKSNPALLNAARALAESTSSLISTLKVRLHRMAGECFAGGGGGG
jgi:hypothetical protein